ncbi:MAG: DNA polymerase III subunit beta [Gemmatimonadetes bacterium]|nr:DNA polymerase III subunit beta [Gemmatimonadota bacterium]
MRFTITRQNLHNGLAAVSASIPTKTTLPVLSNILFDATPDGVRMSGTDLDVAVRVQAAAEVEEAGALTAPGKKLQEIARELPDEPVHVSSRGDQIELKCGRSQFRLNGLPVDEFPTLPQVSFESGWRVGGRDLQALIHHTSFAVSTEESRPILNGVLWELRDGDMRMVATNGHRLAKMTVKVAPSGAPSTQLVVPPTALHHVQRLLGSAEEIEVALSGNYLGFRGAGTEVYTRLIEGTYPNYEQVIPQDNDKAAIVERAAFESALRRMAVVASDQTHRVRLGFRENRVHLNVLTPDLGEGHDELELHYEGEPLEIGFNASYLLEMLRYMPTDELRVGFKGAERAATMEPVGLDEADGREYLYLVMPLRLLD